MAPQNFIKHESPYGQPPVGQQPQLQALSQQQQQQQQFNPQTAGNPV